ncbi:MAG TPA: chemotaxis protein CheW [Polyangiaceae bacterium]|nr:chemotaxis protein CheW [Polyangiaceae bacterium]
MPVHKHRPDPNKSLVGFIVGNVAYAVPISAVKEIVKPLPLTDLPHAPPAVIGVADHRGEVVPVVDLRKRFDVPGVADARATKWILVDSGGRTVGLVVDEVTDVFGTGGAELRPPPVMGGGEDQRGLAGVTNYDGRLVFVLDLQKVETLTRTLPPANLLAQGAT